MPDTYASNAEPCVEEICETTREDLQDRNWLYRWYYFLTYPFLHSR
ncbi:hypothetical protein ACXYMP_04460 [Aliiroseovarius sp. CAU 1755]